MSRPLADVDADEVRKLAAFGCTYREIASFFGVHAQTIKNRFSTEKELGVTEYKMSLRRAQFKRAMEGSDKMLVHLGQHCLGQVDKREERQVSQPATVVILPDNGRDRGQSSEGSPVGR